MSWGGKIAKLYINAILLLFSAQKKREKIVPHFGANYVAVMIFFFRLYLSFFQKGFEAAKWWIR